MNNEIREQVLGMVAGMRAEKTAGARTVALTKSARRDSDKGKDLAATVGSVYAPFALQAATVAPMSRKFRKVLPYLPVGAVSAGNVAEPAAGTVEHAIESVKVKGVPIREFLKRRGIDLQNQATFVGASSPGPVFLPNKGQGRQLLQNLGIDSKNGAILLGFKPGTSKRMAQDVLAHELGHAVRSRYGKLNLKAYTASKLLSLGLGIVGSGRTGSGKASGTEAAAWTAANALAAAPMLNEEIQASRWGSKLVGLKGLRRLGAFRGVPSYLVGATVPAVAYGARRLIDKARGVGK